MSKIGKIFLKTCKWEVTPLKNTPELNGAVKLGLNNNKKRNGKVLGISVICFIKVALFLLSAMNVFFFSECGLSFSMKLTYEVESIAYVLFLLLKAWADNTV